MSARTKTGEDVGDMRLWRASDDRNWYYSDVMGATSALDAARQYVKRSKLDQVDRIAAEPEYPYQCHVVLPGIVYCVPMRDLASFHNASVGSDRDDESEAFTLLWDWERVEEVRL